MARRTRAWYEERIAGLIHQNDQLEDRLADAKRIAEGAEARIDEVMEASDQVLAESKRTSSWWAIDRERLKAAEERIGELEKENTNLQYTADNRQQIITELEARLNKCLGWIAAKEGKPPFEDPKEDNPYFQPGR